MHVIFFIEENNSQSQMRNVAITALGSAANDCSVPYQLNQATQAEFTAFLFVRLLLYSDKIKRPKNVRGHSD